VAEAAAERVKGAAAAARAAEEVMAVAVAMVAVAMAMVAAAMAMVAAATAMVAVAEVVAVAEGVTAERERGAVYDSTAARLAAAGEGGGGGGGGGGDAGRTVEAVGADLAYFEWAKIRPPNALIGQLAAGSAVVAPIVINNVTVHANTKDSIFVIITSARIGADVPRGACAA
jgi:hypothetical protein